jgi:hypothetical protein
MDQDTVRVAYTNGEYHISLNKKGKEIPRVLWTHYVRLRSWYLDSKSEMMSYVNPPKDKPMMVAKNHYEQTEPVVVAPGEIVIFNQDEEDQTSELLQRS